MKLQVFSSKRKVVKVAFLVSLLLVAFTLIPLALADPETPQNITVETAYSMIDGGSFPDLAILDVRNQSEYDINHLYNAVLVPLHELETRIGELDEHMNTEIIVYCGLGGRSEIASGILADNGFTKVYNMLGGITAWIEAEYPVYTTFHHVTVNTTGNRGVHVEIEPLLIQMGCTSCGENQECPSDNEVTNVQITVLEEEEDYTVTLVTYELDGTTFEVTITNSLLWSYSANTYSANTTARFALTEIVTEDITLQYYSLSYVVQHAEYNLTIFTSLKTLNPETYNSSFTIVNYTPVAEFEVPSLELVEFNSSVTLSQLYASLDKVAKKIGQAYTIEGETNDEATLVQLGQNYHKMSKEIKDLSEIVKNQLQEYDRTILESSAILMDADPWWCSLCIITCMGSAIVICTACCAFSGICCGCFGWILTYPLDLVCQMMCEFIGQC